MHVTTRNVNTGFRKFVELFHRGHADGSGEPVAVRERYSNPNGSGYVLRIPGPVLITFTHPRERVLFNAVRDANPFFMLYEVLWMLAGRNDVAPLAYYNSKISGFSDDGKTFNGAYGYRWRHHMWSEGFENDQLVAIEEHLKHDPTSRRAVLQMWDPYDDLYKAGGVQIEHTIGKVGVQPASKDVCCNLNVMFLLRDVEQDPWEGSSKTKVRYLDMTVTNRSNDLLWGTFGGDYVTFSVLQEYVAARLGAEVGLYHHFTNNLHAYCDRPDWKPEELLAWGDKYCPDEYSTCGPGESPCIKPLVRDPATFEEELKHITLFHGGQTVVRSWDEPFFDQVAMPMFQAYWWYKQKEYGKVDGWLRCIKADDWRIACTQWIGKRMKKV